MASSSVDTLMHRISETQPSLPGPVALVIGLGALVFVALPGLAALATHVDTIAHEGAHALVGSGTGRTIKSVTLKSNGDGETSFRPADAGGPGYILAGVVGYLGPSGFGLGGAKLIALGHPVGALWAGLLLLALLFPVVENGFGQLAVIGAGALVFLVLRFTPVGIQVATAYGVAWFLLLAGVRTVLKHGLGAVDADRLKKLTHLPKVAWVTVWLAGSLTALLAGGSLLL